MKSTDLVTHARATLRYIPYFFVAICVFWLFSARAGLAPARIYLICGAAGLIAAGLVICGMRWRLKWLPWLNVMLVPLLMPFLSDASRNVPPAQDIQGPIFFGMVLYGSIWLFRPIIRRICRLEDVPSP